MTAEQKKVFRELWNYTVYKESLPSLTASGILKKEAERRAKWCEVFDKCYIKYFFDDVYKTILVERFINHAKAIVLCRQLYIAPNTLLRHIKEILRFAGLWAQEYGLL